MSDLRIEDKLDLFVDKGIRYYLKRVFWNAADIRREIDAAGYLSDLHAINERVKALKVVKNDQYSTEIGPNSYNRLVERLNDFKQNVSEQDDKVWKALEKDVMSYFKRDLRVYEYVTDEWCVHEGYYLDKKNGLLKYYNKAEKKVLTIGNFDFDEPIFPESKITKARELFPTLLQPRGMFDGILGAKSVKLTPDLFKRMIDHTHMSNHMRNLTFYIPSKGKSSPDIFSINCDFMHTFSLLQERSKAKTLLHKATKGDARDRVTLVKDLIENIKSKIDEELTKLNVYEDIKDNKNTNKKQILEAIKEYLDDADMKKFAQAAAKYDGGYFQRAMKYMAPKDRIDRIVSSFRDMQSSRFFQIAIEEIKKEKKREESNKAQIEEQEQEKIALAKMDEEMQARMFDFPDVISNIDEEKERINKNWQHYRVTKETCLETFANLLQILEDNKVGLPQITLPKTITASLEQGDLENMTVGEYIKLFIEQAIQEVEASKKTSADFQTNCAYVQEKIVEILNFHYTGPSRKSITEEQISAYNKLGDSLYEELKKTKMYPAEEPKVIITAQLVRDEINRLSGVYSALRKDVESLMEEFREIKQTSISNNLLNYLNSKYAEFEQELKSKLEEIKDIQSDAFNSLNPQDENQKLIVKIRDQLVAKRKEVFSHTIRIFSEKVSVDENGDLTDLVSGDAPKGREYISVHTGRSAYKNAEDEGKFKKYMMMVSSLADDYRDITAFNAASVIVPDVKSSSSYSPSMFSTRGRGDSSTSSEDDDFRYTK